MEILLTWKRLKGNSWGLPDGDGAGWVVMHRFADSFTGRFAGTRSSKNYAAVGLLGQSCDCVDLSAGPSFYLSCWMAFRESFTITKYHFLPWSRTFL